jgi:hypothetical protein
LGYVFYFSCYLDRAGEIVRPDELFQKISVDAKRMCSAVIVVSWLFAAAIKAPLAKWFAIGKRIGRLINFGSVGELKTGPILETEVPVENPDSGRVTY